MSSKFKSQSFAFSLIFSALITASCFPVLAFHYWTSLAGFAVVAIGGLLMSDCVLWFSAYWSVRADASLVRVVALVTKFSIAGCAICVASLVIFAMQTDSRQTRESEQATAGRVAEIQARAAAAKDLAGVDRAAARAIAGQGTPSLSVTPSSPVPDWSRSVWLIALLPGVSLVGALALSIAAGLAGQVEPLTENFRQADPPPAPMTAPSRDLAAALPVAARAVTPARVRSGREGKK
jgi:hypothetical protein